MTLPELLICITLIGLLTTVISASIVVSFRQSRSTEGRLNLARAEQNIDVWLPTDLASAASVSTAADGSPCGAPVCGGFDLSTGSTALLLSWSSRVGVQDDDSVIVTTVAYHYAPAGDGTNDLTRIECVASGGAPVCTALVVLRGLAVPLDADGNPTWHPGDPVPSEVIHVTNPLRFEDGAEMSDAENTKNARRVVVTINGGGVGDGNGGGTNQISITAGGTTRGDLPAKAAYQMPSLVQPRSRCGGPMVLIVDESLSLGADGVTAVRAGVIDFIQALDGTPVELMIVPFNDRARALGAGNAYPDPYKWHRYFNMADPAEVDLLRRLVSTDPTIDGTPDDVIEAGGEGPGESNQTGYTNWEDAWFRTFYNKDGSPAAVVPNSVVFFTDGVPNRDRAYSGSFKHDAAANTPLPAGNWGSGSNYHWANSTSNFSQGAFLRADSIAANFRGAVRLIGVAVGPDIDKFNNLVTTSNAQWESHTNSSSSRPWKTAGGSNMTYSSYVDSENPNDGEATNGWTSINYSSVPSSWTSSSSTFYQLNGERTRNSQIVGRLVGGSEVIPFVANGAGDFTNLKTANLFTSPSWSSLGPALEKIALGECGGTISVQTRQGSASGPNVSTTFSYSKAAEYYDAAGSSPVGGALIGTVISTNSVQKVTTMDMNLDDGLDRYVDLIPRGVSSMTTLNYSGWECRSGPNSVPTSLLPVVENGNTVPNWQGVRVRVKANQAVSCTLVVM